MNCILYYAILKTSAPSQKIKRASAHRVIIEAWWDVEQKSPLVIPDFHLTDDHFVVLHEVFIT
jgi:hypothetical protein